MNAADTIKEMMEAWNKIVANIKTRFPEKSDEEVYQIASAVMNKSVGA